MIRENERAALEKIKLAQAKHNEAKNACVKTTVDCYSASRIFFIGSQDLLCNTKSIQYTSMFSSIEPINFSVHSYTDVELSVDDTYIEIFRSD